MLQLSHILTILMVGSQIGMSVIEGLQHNWRNAAVAALVAAANLCVFWRCS